MKVVVVMPAYNAARTLAKTYAAMPEALREHVLLGDDFSADDTYERALALGIDAVRYERNHGYGGNLKRLFVRALEQGAEIVVELHPDYQYEPRVIDLLVEFIKRDYFDVMQGNRIRSRDEALDGGMQWYRYFGNRIITFFENVWFGLTLGEWHSGMKAFRAEVLADLPIASYPDDHAFASEILMDAVMRGYRVGEIPIPVRYDGESSSVGVAGLFRYSLRTFLAAIRRPPWRRRRFGSARGPRGSFPLADLHASDGPRAQ